MAEQIRTFIAIELNDAHRRALAEVQAQLKRDPAARNVRWVAPESIHVTLKFLGGVDAGKIPAVERAVAEACSGFSPFTLTMGGLGAFPNAKRPRVLWVGIGGAVETVEQLADKIEAACNALGFAREDRPFSPHLTLGRVKREARPSDWQEIAAMIEHAQADNLGEIQVEMVSVMKSDLRPTGSVYTQLAAIPLSGK